MTFLSPRHVVTAAIFLAAAAPAVRAQSVHDSLGWHLTGNLGYVQTSGNTELKTINLGDKLTLRPNRTWLFTQTAAFIYGYNDTTETANQALAGLRADYFLKPQLSIYGLVGYERNPFAGLDRRYEESVGLSWIAVKQPKAELQLDLGVGANQQTTGAVETNFMSARLAPRFRYNLSTSAYLEESIELVENLDDTGDLRSMSLTQLVAPVTSGIAVGVSTLSFFSTLA